MNELPLMKRHGSQPDWRALHRLNKTLRREFSPQGIVRVELVLAFSEPFDFWVWLSTTTDAERDHLQRDSTVDCRIRLFASTHKVETPYEGFTVKSQQTIDRDYDRSQFHRLR
jgi:hypothetical protein